MWYKNKDNRIKYIKSIPIAKVTLEQIKESYYTYFAIFEKEHNKYIYTCTKCGTKKTIKKRRYAYRCSECGMIFDYHHIKNKRFKNYFDKFILKVENNNTNLQVYDFLYIEVIYDSILKSLVFSNPEVIVRQFYCEEKNKTYVHNYAYGSQNYYSFYYKSDKKTSEHTNRSFTNYIEIKTNNDTNYLQYIDLTDKDLKGIKEYDFKEYTYNIELLQKYNSLYLLHKTHKNKDKVVDMLGLRTYISKYQAVKLLQLHAKNKSLDLQIYQDYISMCRTFNKGELTEEDIFNTDYRKLHDDYALRIKVANPEKKSELLLELSKLYKDKKIEDYYIIHPKSVEDFLEEADQLKHCVKSYINKTVKGITQIFFVRKEKDKSLITCEVKDGNIEQFYGYRNTTNIEGYEVAKYAMQQYINEEVLRV